MPLYLMRHAENINAQQNPKKPLSKQGILQAKSIANQAKHYIPELNQIIHSNKERAIQTAQTFKTIFNPSIPMTTSTDLSPEAEAQHWHSILLPEQNDLLIAHLPFLDRLIALLVTNNEDALIAQFDNASLFCLEKNTQTKTWSILWALKPISP